MLFSSIRNTSANQLDLFGELKYPMDLMVSAVASPTLRSVVPTELTRRSRL
jgi:hypothetical protein